MDRVRNGVLLSIEYLLNSIVYFFHKCLSSFFSVLNLSVFLNLMALFYIHYLQSHFFFLPLSPVLTYLFSPLIPLCYSLTFSFSSLFSCLCIKFFILSFSLFTLVSPLVTILVTPHLLRLFSSLSTILNPFHSSNPSPIFSFLFPLSSLSSVISYSVPFLSSRSALFHLSYPLSFGYLIYPFYLTSFFDTPPTQPANHNHFSLRNNLLQHPSSSHFLSLYFQLNILVPSKNQRSVIHIFRSHTSKHDSIRSYHNKNREILINSI